MKEKKIISELVEKIEDYETNMSTWLEDANTAADIYRIKPPTRKSNAYSNPARVSASEGSNGFDKVIEKSLPSYAGPEFINVALGSTLYTDNVVESTLVSPPGSVTKT